MDILEFPLNFAILGAEDIEVSCDEGVPDEEGENDMELLMLPSLFSLEEAEEALMACCISCFLSTETEPKLMLELVNSLLGRLLD